MPNVPVPDHPLAGTEQVYLPPGESPHPDANTRPGDGRTVARHGDTVVVLEVFENWNGVSGLTMAYVYVPATGYRTHFSPLEMGLSGYGEADADSPQAESGQARRAAGGARRPARRPGITPRQTRRSR